MTVSARLLSDLERFLDDAMAAWGSSRSDLARSMGYPKAPKAIYRFDRLLAAIEDDREFCRRLSDVLGFPDELLSNKIAEIRRVQVEEDAAAIRSNFHPHLRVVTLWGRPSSGWSLKLAVERGAWKMPDVHEHIMLLGEAECFDAIGAMIRDHFTAYAEIGARLFGGIQGYFFMVDPDRGVKFTVSGRYIGEQGDVPIWPTSGIKLVEDRYIEQVRDLIDGAIAARGIRRGALVREMGYAHPEIAYSQLDALRSGVEGAPDFMARLRVALRLQDGQLDTTLGYLRAAQQAEVRAAFGNAS